MTTSRTCASLRSQTGQSPGGASFNCNIIVLYNFNHMAYENIKKYGYERCPFLFPIKNIAFFSFHCVLILTALNALYNSLAVELLRSFPYSTFLFNPYDLFADFFKFIFSYPGADKIYISGTTQIDKLLLYFQHHPNYAGLSGLASGHITHFHVTPLTTVFYLTNKWLMLETTPFADFILMVLIFFYIIVFNIKHVAKVKIDKFYFMSLTFFSYPVLLVIARGNIISGIASLSVVYFLVVMYQNDRCIYGIFSLAIAANIRPNAIIFILAILLLKRQRLQYVLLFFLTASTIFLVSLFTAHHLYQDYTLKNFVLGLMNYHNIYVAGNDGLAYGSSLFGCFKMMLGYNEHFEFFVSLLGAGISLLAILEYCFKFLSKNVLVYILCVIYCLFSPVFADYHLLVFIAPIFCAYLGTKNCSNSLKYTNVTNLLILIPCLLVISPKNYLFSSDISWQVVINPVILLFSALSLLIISSIQKNRPLAEIK